MNRSVSQRSIQIELIFRLLLKITVDGPPECDLINFCPPRGGKTIRENALKFSKERFEREIKEFVIKKYQEFKGAKK